MELPASSSDINISDVIEVIETESKMEVGRREEPYIKITEQPASKALRFRYECEGRSAGSIPGVNSSPENKTYPTIQIVGHKGRVVVVVSCVTKEGPPFRPHPHNLVGRDGCKKGVCTVEVNNETMTQSFDHLGIQCVKKKDIEEALKAREEIRVDPFRTGFSHRTQPGSIDLNAVRLTFQAFLMDGPNNKFALKPVVSDIIYDKKALCDLAICKLSHCSAPVAGGMEMILLCEKVAKEDISVRFFEERNGKVVWEGSGDFSPTHVHKQVAITFKTPKYKTLQIETPVQVYIQLQRLSDKETSDPLPFQFTPLDSGRPAFWSLRRYKADYRTFSSILSADTKLLTKAGNPSAPDLSVNSATPQEKLVSSTLVIDNRPQVVVPVQQDTNNNTQPSTPDITDSYNLLNKGDVRQVVSVVNTQEKLMEINQDFHQQVDPGEDYPIELSPEESNKIDDVFTDLVDNAVEQGFDDLIEQVNNLDEIVHSELENNINTGNDGIYSSFQMAMKNPFEFTDYNTSGYEDVIPPRPSAAKPVIRPEQNESLIQSQVSGDVLPPLPPKRIRKSPPRKNLPPVPEGKKLNIFQKLFSSKRKDKSRKNSISSIGSRKSLAEDRSALEPVKVENIQPDDVTLTEAEHYALYTAFAPHATASEFDETSFYYSPVEGQTQVVK